MNFVLNSFLTGSPGGSKLVNNSQSFSMCSRGIAHASFAEVDWADSSSTKASTSIPPSHSTSLEVSKISKQRYKLSYAKTNLPDSKPFCSATSLISSTLSVLLIRSIGIASAQSSLSCLSNSCSTHSCFFLCALLNFTYTFLSACNLWSSAYFNRLIKVS